MSKMTLTEKDHGATVRMQVGDEVSVALAENPSTGFLWAVDHLDEDALASASDEYALAEGVGMGGGGTRTLTYRALKAGETKLAFKLWREWEGDVSVTQRFSVQLVVR